jgi:hypothetical protein
MNARSSERISMANLWQLEESRWVRRLLADDALSLAAAPQAAARRTRSIELRIGVTLKRYGTGESTLWVLLSSGLEKVSVNGQPLLAGLCLLHDRDEILIGAQRRLYYSTEELASVEPFPGGNGPVYCARCRQAIQPATPAVRCPACGHWCEQSETKPCWTYGPTCPMCEQPTAFDTGLRWSPEEL